MMQWWCYCDQEEEELNYISFIKVNLQIVWYFYQIEKLVHIIHNSHASLTLSPCLITDFNSMEFVLLYFYGIQNPNIELVVQTL